MKRSLDLGFIALTDAAPLIVAKELGYFDEAGLSVALHREVSWATIRDKVCAGIYQGAHMLAPMALATHLGGEQGEVGVLSPLSLNAHGAAVGVSHALAREMAAAHANAPLSSAALAAVLAERRRIGAPAPVFASVFPYSMHNYMLRYWLADAGIDPDADLRMTIAAPTAIASRLRSRDIDGFCVGAPWPALCARDIGARLVLDAGSFWRGGPDKVLGLSEAWANTDAKAAEALTVAVLRGAMWADAPENKEALIALLARADYVNAEPDVLAERLGPDAPVNIRFARAAEPRAQHAAWILSQMARWGQVAPDAAFARAMASYRTDLFADAAAFAGLAPVESAENGESPFDAAPRDHDDITRYAASFTVTRVAR